MSYDRENDTMSERITLDDISEHAAMGYDAAPRVGEYQYKMVRRPFSIGCQPKEGFIRYDEEFAPGASGYYGIVTYSRQLSQAEVARYELVEIEDE